MATNGRDGMTPNTSFSDNSSSRKEEGIFGYLKNRNTKSDFSRDYWREGSGYLDASIKNLKEMQKQYKELEKIQGKMTASQEKEFKNKKRELEIQLSMLEDIKSNQEVSDKEAIKSIKEANRIRQQGLKSANKIYDDIADKQEKLKNGDKELAKQIKADAKDRQNLLISATKEMEQQSITIEATGETLKNTQVSFSKAMSNTLGSFSKGLMDLSNMFNLDKLASMNNSGLNKFINDKISVQNEMMKQFGFETKSQYIDFKNGLDSTLASMGSLYNGTDLKNYMSNLSSMGITNTKMAQDQMRASIMGTKYLGVSAETQTEMFKWMKRTNDYDMLDEHNKVITGLLKSQLGVSKEQLDALSLIAYGELESKSALGMSPEAVQAQSEASSIMGAVLTNMYDAKTAGAIQSALNDFMINPGDSGWISTFGGNYQGIYDSLFTSNTKEGQLNAMYKFLQGIQNSGLLNVTAGNGGLTTAIGNKRTNTLTSLGDDVIAALQGSSFNGSKYLDLQQKALDGLLDTNTEQFIQETTEITWLEKIYNTLNRWVTAWDSANLTSLANAAFTLWVTSKIFSLAADIKDLGLIPKLINSSGAMSSLGAVGSGILSAGGGILLGAGTANIISTAIEAYHNKVAASEKAAAVNSLKGTNLEGNSAAINALGLANASDQSHSKLGGFGSAWSTATTLVGLGVLGWSRDLATMNQDSWKLMNNSLNMRNMSPEARQRYITAWQLLLMSAGRQSDISTFSGIENSELASYMRSMGWTKKMMDDTVASFDGIAFTYPNKSTKSAQTTIDWNKLNLDGYHKAGLNKVPRDNYKALLHKGEMVLNEEEANAYRRGFGIGGYEAVPWPITSKYNSMSKIRSGYHTGTDFGAAAGTPVGAAIGGEIIQKSWGGAFGNHIIIRGDNGLYYLYAHLSRKAVEGGRVNTGQTIGYVGSTGNSTGPHLHFEVQRSSSWARGNELDPAPYVTSGLLGDSSAISPTQEEVYGSLNAAQNASSSGIIKNSDGSTSSTIASSGIPVRTGRFSIFNNSSTKNTGMGGADRIVNSVNGGFGKLMSYLDNIRQEQDVQREMISAFSRTNTESTI